MLKRRIAAIGIVVGVAISASAVNTPTYALSPQESGDPQLLNTVRPLLAPDKYDNVSVGYVDGKTNTIKTAHFGSNNATEYEIGSISKTFIGNLYAEALSKKEVTNTQKVGSILPIGTGMAFPAGNRTLDELTSHRSGLPSFPSTPGMLAQITLMQQTGRSINFTEGALVQQAQATFYLPSIGSYQYSNMGASLLGQSLAKAAKVDYKTLVTNRMFVPLGLSNTYIAVQQSDVAPNKPRGTRDDGLVPEASAWGAYSSSGTVRSTTTDMTTYISKLLKNQVPGQTATTPRWDLGNGQRIGYNWFTDSNNRTWHNGQTSGFGTMLKFDKAANKGVIIMADRPRGEDLTNNQLAETILNANL